MNAAILSLLAALSLPVQAFQWNPPGQLQAGNQGRADERVYAPGMRFPLETAPAYPNSQVYMAGGSHGPGGGQCAAQNYAYPWWDNYCEPRHWDVPLCPGGTGHQGQDIRPSTCADKVHWAVAAEDGRITSIGSYSVYLVTASGRRHRYLHLAPETVQVREGQAVTRGQRIGKVSNAYFDSDGNRVGTTIHLHYDLHMAVASQGRAVYVPPYMSLVRSYEPLLGDVPICEAIPSQGGVVEETGPCFQRWGPEDYWRYVDGEGHGGSYLWTNAFVNETPSNWGRWNLKLAEAGNYAVEVHVVPPHNRAQRIPYLVRASGEEHRLLVRQAGQSGWLRIGAFDFAAGEDQKVEVFDNSGEEGADLHMTVDSLRLVRLEVAPPADAGPPAPDASQVVSDAGPRAPVDVGSEDSGVRRDAGRWAKPADTGCGCVGGIDVSLLILFALFGLRRRRRVNR